MTEPEHTFTARYRVVGRSLYEQLADWAEQDTTEPEQVEDLDAASAVLDEVLKAVGAYRTTPYPTGDEREPR